MKWLPLILLPAFLGVGEVHCDDAQSIRFAGRDLYQQYCATCHGVSGRGDGPDATSLSVAPADLTRLGERYGRPLPAETIATFVDGRHAGGHGREMPAFGEVFFAGKPPDMHQEHAKRVALLLLVDYLESIQPGRGTQQP